MFRIATDKLNFSTTTCSGFRRNIETGNIGNIVKGKHVMFLDHVNQMFVFVFCCFARASTGIFASIKGSNVMLAQDSANG